MTDFHGRIMNIQRRHKDVYGEDHRIGHRDARHAAAEIAVEADALIAELRDALACVAKEAQDAHDWIEGYFSSSEIELDQSIADAHAGLGLAAYDARTVIAKAGEKRHA